MFRRLSLIELNSRRKSNLIIMALCTPLVFRLPEFLFLRILFLIFYFVSDRLVKRRLLHDLRHFRRFFDLLHFLLILYLYYLFGFILINIHRLGRLLLYIVNFTVVWVIKLFVSELIIKWSGLISFNFCLSSHEMATSTGFLFVLVYCLDYLYSLWLLSYLWRCNFNLHVFTLSLHLNVRFLRRRLLLDFKFRSLRHELRLLFCWLRLFDWSRVTRAFFIIFPVWLLRHRRLKLVLLALRRLRNTASHSNTKYQSLTNKN